MDEKDKRIAELERQNAALLQRIEELERRLGMNSSNSSKPPSFDGYAKPTKEKGSKHRSLRCKGKNNTGGQKGHQGTTLNKVATPDETIEHPVNVCKACGNSLEAVEADSFEARQVFDIPEPKLMVTEHRVCSKVCTCGHKTKSQFPADIKAPTQYGNRIKATSVYLLNQQFIPEDRLQQLFQDLFGFKIATDTLISFNTKFAKAVKPFQDNVLEQLMKALVKHLDESGARIAGKLHWLHSISTSALTHYRFAQKRGDLLEGVEGTVVHDHWKRYYKMPNVVHALCNAHHLRELKALMDKETWAKKMFSLLCLASRLKNRFSHVIEKAYDKIVQLGLTFHKAQPPLITGKRKKRTGHNLLIRLEKFKEDVLRFLNDTNVPFTNNQAEQDIRMIKVKQKISGCFRTPEGADNFATIRGFISTKRKQNHNVFNEILAYF